MNVDAALLIGDRGKIHPVRGENKCFLQLQGMPLFLHVLRALESSEKVRRIFVVGDRDRLEKTIAGNVRHLKSPERLVLCEQGRNLFDNVMIAFREAEALYTREGHAEMKEERAIFYLPGDIPLVTPEEIDDFLDQCDMERYDLFAGTSTQESLRPFYPTKNSRGIRMACFYTKEKICRQNNFYLAKPLKVRNRHYIQEMYDLRYQKEFINFARLLWTFFREHIQVQGIASYLILHWNLLMSRLGLVYLIPPFRQLVGIEDIEKFAGAALGSRVKIIETRFTGAALDIDNERDYETITIMFERWRDYQRSLLTSPQLANLGSQGRAWV